MRGASQALPHTTLPCEESAVEVTESVLFVVSDLEMKVELVSCVQPYKCGTRYIGRITRCKRGRRKFQDFRCKSSHISSI